MSSAQSLRGVGQNEPTPMPTQPTPSAWEPTPGAQYVLWCLGFHVFIQPSSFAGLHLTTICITLHLMPSLAYFWEFQIHFSLQDNLISEIWCKFCHEGWAGWDMQTLICLGRGWTWPCLNWAKFCLDGLLWYQKSTRVACFFWTQKNRWSGNSANTSPRHHRDTSDAWARHHRDTSEAWARHHWGRHHRDTTKTPPRHHRDTIETSPETPPRQAVGFSDFELHISAPSSNSPWPPYWFQIYLCVWRHCCRGPLHIFWQVNMLHARMFRSKLRNG